MTINTEPKTALEIADTLETVVLEIANGKRKPQRIPLEPIVKAYEELRRLDALVKELQRGKG